MNRKPPTEGVSEAVEAIFAVIDQRASELLDIAFSEHTSDSDGKAVTISLGERIKAFDSVVEYAAIRAKVEPPKRALKETTFAGLHKRFHGEPDGDAPLRGGSRRKAASKGGPEGTPGHA